MNTRKLKVITPEIFQAVYYTVSDYGYKCTPIVYNRDFSYPRFWEKFLTWILYKGKLYDLVDSI